MNNSAKKKFCCNNIDLLSHKDRIDIGKFLYRNNCSAFIQESGGNILINLDLLENENAPIISLIYNIIKHKLDKKNGL